MVFLYLETGLDRSLMEWDLTMAWSRDGKWDGALRTTVSKIVYFCFTSSHVHYMNE